MIDYNSIKLTLIIMPKEKNFYYKKDRLNQLRGFCVTVQNECSIKKASERTGIESATISRQISALERDINISLFDRSVHRKLTLTSEGQIFYNDAVTKLQAIDGLFKDYAKVIKESEKNTLKIVGNYTFISTKLPKYIKKLLEKSEFKNLKIEITNISTEEGIKDIIAGNVDIGFFPLLHSYKVPVELDIKNIFRWNSVMLVSKNHPLANKKNININDFAKYPYFFLDEYVLYNPGDSIPLTPSKIIFKGADWNLVINYVENNLGMLVITDDYMKRMMMDTSIYKKININKFLPLMYFSYVLRKNYKHKNAVKFLIKEMKKDSDAN